MPHIISNLRRKITIFLCRIYNAEINKDFDKLPAQWEKLENWFWKKRRNGNDTSDVGLEEFLRWVAVIEKRNEKSFVEETINTEKLSSKKRFQFPYDSISFKTICDYWDALQLLVKMQMGAPRDLCSHPTFPA